MTLAKKDISNVDFSNPTEMIASLLETPPETALDLRATNDALSLVFNDELPAIGDYQRSVPINGHVSCDVAVPMGEGPYPVLIYLHGGAWVAGSAQHYEKLSHRFAEAGYLTFAINYRLAPEHPFPAGYEDCLDAVAWVMENANQWNGDTQRVAVGGDSAGGNLSAAIHLGLAERGLSVGASVLIYGAFDFKAMLERPAHSEVDERVNLANQIAADAYLGAEPGNLLTDPRVSPYYDVSHYPPTHVVVGAFDALLVQSDALVEKLKSAGIEHEYFVDEGMPHGYLQMENLPGSRPAFQRIVEFLDRTLG